MDRYDEIALRTFRAAMKKIYGYDPLVGLPHDNLNELVGIVASGIRKKLGQARPPGRNETFAISVCRPKTAALFFDRVWWPSPGVVPEEIAAYGATEFEILVGLLFVFHNSQDYDGSVDAIIPMLIDRAKSLEREGIIPDGQGREIERAIGGALLRDRSIQAIPIYDSFGGFEHEYRPGSSECIVAALDGLELAVEGALSWGQVLEMRKDKAAKEKLRRLRHWFDHNMIGKEIPFIVDELATRLSDYEWALKKYGVKTATGVAADLLDPKFIAAVGASSATLVMAGADLWAAIGVASVAIGRVALSITSRYIDFRDDIRCGSEVAFVHELKKLGPK